jgi:hypothetical protein
MHLPFYQPCCRNQGGYGIVIDRKTLAIGLFFEVYRTFNFATADFSANRKRSGSFMEISR